MSVAPFDRSPTYMDWMARIQRRDQLHELEQQLALVQTLIERQAKADDLFIDITPVVAVGDAVEFAGKPYRVHQIGSSYVQLKSNDGDGAIIRCQLDQIRLLEKATV
ncbi:hypothetical protein [Leptolyngbya sp. 7M]|uniref:hypothetical protein n=1 Tax=Leptolyngbya sp. 7M TaxID=2812896 RepID=UPI001B8BBF7E|nr:hypothetical protein [Leptolyngbya sp. 7M]QYO65103.1 hypothetical protein JVX88_37320 [Leptolyngbya sp. 7M]